MSKPRLFNRPNKPEELGGGAVESGGVEEKTGTGGEGEEGKERAEHDTPSPPRYPAPGREKANHPEERDIRPDTERRRRSRIPRGHKRTKEGTERPHGGPD